MNGAAQVDDIYIAKRKNSNPPYTRLHSKRPQQMAGLFLEGEAVSELGVFASALTVSLRNVVDDTEENRFVSM